MVVIFNIGKIKIEINGEDLLKIECDLDIWEFKKKYMISLKII